MSERATLAVDDQTTDFAIRSGTLGPDVVDIQSL